MKTNSGLRSIIFGLDGASFHVLDDLIRRGAMPNLAALIEKGVRGPLLSTVPPLTPIAWSSLVTGRTPGHHGITGFFQFDAPNSFSLRIVSARELRSETVWSMVNRHGLRAGSLNFPIHCPPPRIDGYVIPGWLPWKWIRMFSHPAGLVERLQSEIPTLKINELAMDFEEEKKSIAGAAIDNHKNWIDVHIRRDQSWFDVLRHQIRKDPCDLTGIVFDGVDKLQHLLWPYLDPDLEPKEPSEAFLRIRKHCWAYFRQVDQFLGETLSLAAEPCSVFVVSDHGFTGTSEILHINAWLEQRGYLAWKPEMEFIEDDCRELEPDFYKLSAFDLDGTKAFALTASSNGVHIVKQKTPGGPGVQPHEYEAFRSRLREALLTELVDEESGEPLILDVLTREQAFFGPSMELAPDLTVRLRDDGFFSVRRSRKILTRRVDVMGTHHPEGVFLACGPGIRAGLRIAPIRLIDVVPTVLYSLGVPIPADLEGRVVEEIFTPSHLREYRAVQGGAASTRDQSSSEELQNQPVLSPHDEELVLERLRALGYLE